MNALDNTNESSCWNSDGDADGNTAISFVLSFHRTVTIQEIRIQFQGGFVAEECTLFLPRSSTAFEKKGDGMNTVDYWEKSNDTFMEPEDSNEMQCFNLTEESESDRICDSLKIEFRSSTDFYGRVTIYKLEVWGDEP